MACRAYLAVRWRTMAFDRRLRDCIQLAHCAKMARAAINHANFAKLSPYSTFRVIVFQKSKSRNYQYANERHYNLIDFAIIGDWKIAN